ncbi:spermidine/putrescine ABC transporter permease [Paramagnetospirillum marisnigri]|uniref:Spermidine/putrescine ABC transporter permease n=1 Tax=Paramagnetospirillum marisnigri TaxID=1285242 RepID=A0A178M920_9PROT|nr:ABC transporter permease subunit [Paramagnetospirillum marisnigri]OAN44717.1 spermidine/putrescine ABC transporter permease [Paramagnetospirillum marisnigri]
MTGRFGRFLVGLPPYAWLALFFLVPFLIVLKISLSEPSAGAPPYLPLWEWDEAGNLAFHFNPANYGMLFGDDLYLSAYLNSIRIAGISTLACLALGYPAAYAIARAPLAWRQSLLLLVALPFWTSFLIRVYAWIGILKTEGMLNAVLLWAGVISEPLQILQTDLAVIIGMTYSYLPFMVLPLYATLEKMDLTLLEAAADLGCRPFKAFLAVTLPLSMPGVIAGSLLVFIPAVGEYVIPDLLGGPDTLMIGKVLWAEFFDNRDWPVASAVAIAMLVLLVAPIMIIQNARTKAEEKAEGRTGR